MVIPKPFARPSIDLDHHGKRWQELPAAEVRAGDMVATYGLIHEATTMGNNVLWRNVDDKTSLVRRADLVRVFR